MSEKFSEDKVEIELENFSYSDLNSDSPAKKFFGRTKELKKFKELLGRKGGSYLISGYRGVGKTRFTEVALDQYLTGRDGIKIQINLGGDNNLSSKTVLFNMVSLLNEELKNLRFNLCLRFKLIKKNLLKIISLIWSNIVPSLMIVILLAASIPLLSSISSELLMDFPEVKKYIDILNPYFYGNETNTLFGNFNTTSVLAFISILLVLLSLYYFSNLISRSQKELENLLKDMSSTSENNLQLGTKYTSFQKKNTASPLDNNQIESRLKKILDDLESNNLEIIFVFDELDKLSGNASERKDFDIDIIKESKLRKQQIDSILGDLKNLITSSKAKYIFIAGRDMYDAYLSERGSSNSLYESLFNGYIYLPSLLTDRSDEKVYLLDSMIESFVVSNLIRTGSSHKDSITSLGLIDYTKAYEKKKSREKLWKEVFILKALIHFLALHSWGNFKRLITLFESFVRASEDKSNSNSSPNQKSYKLSFSTNDIQRLILASQLYIMFHHNLSRMLMNADDKLVVSSFSVFHYILKYHGLGFSTDHVLKTYEIINIHSSPELTRIVSIIINNVLHNHLRRVRNSFYRFRFSLLHEQEIHYITTISDGESAAFNFSLNAMDAVIQYYKSIIDNNQRSFPNEQYGDISIASIHIIIGNFHFWERAYDEALIHYGIASDILEKNYCERENLAKISAAAQFIEVQLKQGSVAERMGNYSTAAAIYMNAEEVADKFLAILKIESVHDKDSKWDVFRQPKWARNFLNLKRSAIHYSNNKLFLPDNSESTDISMYRKAVLSLFMEDFHAAFLNFMEVASVADCKSERSSYLGGNAYLKAGFSLLLIFSNNLYKQLINRETSDKKNSSINAILMLADLIQGVNESINILDSLTDTEKSTEIGKEIRNQHETHFYNIDPKNENVIKQAFILMIKSSSFFSEGELHINSAISNLSIVMMWEALLEMLPLHSVDELIPNDDELHGDPELAKEITEAKNKINGIKDVNFKEKVIKIRNNLIYDMQEKAFTSTGNNTGHAFSHSMKSTLSKSLDIPSKDWLFAKKVSTRDMVFHEDFLKYYLYQHYSVFGQAIIASIYWEEITAKSICEATIDLTSFENAQLLPYSVRYYATMLWLKGRNHLHHFFENKDPNKSIEEAFLAIINFFRSSQYVIKTQGESIGVILPPLFLIYYNMWEVLYRLVQLKIEEPGQLTNQSYEESVLKVREEMEELFKKHNINDISSRVFDLSHVAPLALMQLKTIEQMADLNSRNRTGILRNKYFLDDDYEDNLFNLDWCYSRFFAPSALVYGKIIESKMKLIISRKSQITSTRQYKVLPNPLTRTLTRTPPPIQYARCAGTC